MDVVQFNRDNEDELIEFLGSNGFIDGEEVVVHSLEKREFRASRGSYVVKGVEGEMWIVQESIFEKTYERVE